jgi:hypothetical protein
VQLEVHGHVAAGEQRPVAVRHVHLGEERAGAGVDRIRRPRHRPREDPIRLFAQRDVGRLADPHVECVGLRHVHEDAQDVDLRDAEELGRLPRGAGRDERPGIDVAHRDDAVEGRIDALEPGELLQAIDGRLVGADGGLAGIDRLLGRGRRGRAIVDLLLRHGAHADADEALRRPAGQLQVGLELHKGGLALRERPPRLVELLVDLRRLDLGDESARRHVVADVHVARLQVAVDARVDPGRSQGCVVPGSGTSTTAGARCTCAVVTLGKVSFSAWACAGAGER